MWPNWLHVGSNLVPGLTTYNRLIEKKFFKGLKQSNHYFETNKKNSLTCSTWYNTVNLLGETMSNILKFSIPQENINLCLKIMLKINVLGKIITVNHTWTMTGWSWLVYEGFNNTMLCSLCSKHWIKGQNSFLSRATKWLQDPSTGYNWSIMVFMRCK